MREHKRELKKTGGGPHPPSPPQLPGDDVAVTPPHASTWPGATKYPRRYFSNNLPSKLFDKQYLRYYPMPNPTGNIVTLPVLNRNIPVIQSTGIYFTTFN